MTDEKIIQENMNNSKGTVSQICIDRGNGKEYFDVVGFSTNAVGNTLFTLETDDIIGADFLADCEYVEFFYTNSKVIKEDVPYIVTFKESEIRQIVRNLMNCYDRLYETKNVIGKEISIFDTEEVEQMADNLWALKKKFVDVVNTQDEGED